MVLLPAHSRENRITINMVERSSLVTYIRGYDKEIIICIKFYVNDLTGNTEKVKLMIYKYEGEDVLNLLWWKLIMWEMINFRQTTHSK